MFESVKIAPSILSANFMQLKKDIELVETSGAGYVHVDVMDGHFVPNLTFGVPLVKQLKKSTVLPLDVHLMISNPKTQIPWFIDAGSDLITFHVEAVETVEEQIEIIDMIHNAGIKASASIKPKTPVTVLGPLIDKLDMVLIMSVEPGFSGQSYIEGSEEKVAQVVQMAHAHDVKPLIEVDGGIGVKTVERVCKEGADILVTGNAFFAAENPVAALKCIERLGNEAR